jgi:hypothetical protein
MVHGGTLLVVFQHFRGFKGYGNRILYRIRQSAMPTHGRIAYNHSFTAVKLGGLRVFHCFCGSRVAHFLLRKIPLVVLG